MSLMFNLSYPLLKVFLNMELGYAQGLRFYQMQQEIMSLCVMPDKLLDLVPSMAARHTLILADLLSVVTN